MAGYSRTKRRSRLNLRNPYSFRGRMSTPGKSRFFGQAAVWTMMIIALVHLCWSYLSPDSDLSVILNLVIHERKDPFDDPIADCAAVDSLASEAQSNGGNGFLSFRGFDASDPLNEHIMRLVYYRSTYWMYPGRMFIGPPSQIINNGMDIGRLKFSPDQQWLRDRQVRALVSVSKDASGAIRTEVGHISPASPGNQ